MYKYLAAAFACASVLQAAPAYDAAQAYQALRDFLHSELRLLESVTDASSAARCVEPLGKLLSGMAADPAIRDDSEESKLLQDYLVAHPEEMRGLLICLQRLSIHFAALQEKNFYVVEELRKLLAPQLEPQFDSQPEQEEGH